MMNTEKGCWVREAFGQFQVCKLGEDGRVKCWARDKGWVGQATPNPTLFSKEEAETLRGML